ncbi:MAG: hypothetical protein LUC33_04855 [Prevotellaceae bacterium]|nr:hypothetical protein [Prevotellaceae bacterium]
MNDGGKDTDRDIMVEVMRPVSANGQRRGGISVQNAETNAKNALDRRTDDVEDFDQMEIDALLIDEAHNYKKLGGETALAQSVKGVDLGDSQRSQGLYLKARAVMEKNNGRNVIFATGTPISNTAAEVWNFMRYLMPEEALDEYGIRYFDDFVNNFGNIDKDFEYTTSGNLKEVTRFRGYGNLPELARLWTSVADIVLNRDLVKDNVEDKRPQVEGGKPRDVFLPQNGSLMSVMDYVRKSFDWYEHLEPFERYKNKTLPGKWYNMAQGAAVDARLVWPKARDEKDSKTNETVRLTLADLKETERYNGTVAIFCDRIQNPKTGFNLFEDIKAKLVKGGVPENRIAIIKSGMSNKEKIFEKVNSGEIRVVMGSTYTLGTGVNIQERLHTLIHMDAPNRPMDYTQRNGRIHRQGNLHKDMGIPIRIIRLGIEDTLDKTAYQRLEFKAAFIDSLMNVEPLLTNNGKAVRVINAEADELQNFGNTKASLSGNQYAVLQSRAKKKVDSLRMDRERWKFRQSYVTETIPKKERGIRLVGDRVAADGKALEEVGRRFPGGTAREITIMGSKAAIGSDLSDIFTEHNKKILRASKDLLNDRGWNAERKERDIIEADGLKFEVTTQLRKRYVHDQFGSGVTAGREMTYSCPDLGLKDVPVKSGLIRVAVEDILQNVVTGKTFEDRIARGKEWIESERREIATLKDEAGKPFDKEDELIQAESDYEEYTQKMIEEQKEIDAREAARRGNGQSQPVEISDINMDFGDDEPGQLRREGPAETPVRDESELSSHAMTRSMERTARDMADRLHLGNVEILTDTSSLSDDLMNSRGFYDTKTGKITIVVPNHEDSDDVAKTVLHEAVAHYGLRQMFGRDFSRFLRDVYESAPLEVRRKIAEETANNGWNIGHATEEYLASLAEEENFKKAGSLWNRIKGFFRDMLRRIGLLGKRLTDNDLRYILWKSYQNLRGRKGVVDQANDVAMQDRLQVGEHDRDEILRRRRDSFPNYEKALARDRYEKRVSSGWYQSVEAMQDSMRGLMEAMEAIVGKRKGRHIEDIEGFENPYLGENRLSSVNEAETEAFSRLVFRPMLREVAGLARNRAERQTLIDYMMAKHGLERNVYMAERDAKAFVNGKIAEKEGRLQRGLSEDEKKEMYERYYPKEYEKNRKRDYAGLTALTDMEELPHAEDEARDMVRKYEERHDTKALWEKVNAVNAAILSKEYECGMLSKDTYDKIGGMYKWYIPLRGFDERTAEDSYAYLGHPDSAFNAPIRAARGRSSKADDPLATMQQMAESAISQGNRNRLVKQKFLNFVMNHPSDLVSISDVWVRYDDTRDEWVPVFPDLRPEDDADTVDRKLREFEEKMNSLREADPDRYKHGRDAASVPYRIESKRDVREHQVIVRRDGRDYVLTINGNPRAAQALNGQTNPDTEGGKWAGALMNGVDRINRFRSAIVTTFSPNFMTANFARDMVYVNTMVWVKESPAYALRFHRNVLECNPATMGVLLGKYLNDGLDDSKPLERSFRQFMLNGGETGYTSARTLEQHKRDVDREIREMQWRLPANRALGYVKDAVEDTNRAVEMCGRFAAFLTSRHFGRSVDRAIWDAKEISVNFNKKGSGERFWKEAGQKGAGNLAAFTSGTGRHFYIFWNAAVQGLTNMGRQAARHPAKFWASQAALFALGVMAPTLFALLHGGGGDDDKDRDGDRDGYLNLPEYTRRSNIMFPLGSYWAAIPLSQEFRISYGLGEICGSLMAGQKMDSAEIAMAVMGQVSQALPLDLVEAGAGWPSLLPSAVQPVVEAARNRSWTGLPIYNGSEYAKDMPAWTKAYSNTGTSLVNLCATLNEVAGGDDATVGMKALDWNPAVIEYLLNSYLGGPMTFANQLAKTAETIAGRRDFNPQDIPMLNRVLKAGDERTEYRAVNEAFYKLNDEVRRTKARARIYESLDDRDVIGYAERLDFLYDSPEYERMEIYDDYAPDLKACQQELVDARLDGDEEAAREIRADINEERKALLEEAAETYEDRKARRARRRERREALREAGWRPGVNR